MMVDLNVVIAGAAGEGVQTVGEVLARAIAGHGYAVFAWQEFESRIRGGQNSYSIRISEKPANAPAMRADILLALNDGAAMKYGRLIQTDGILIAEKKSRDRMIPIAFADIDQKERTAASEHSARVAPAKGSPSGRITTTYSLPSE